MTNLAAPTCPKCHSELEYLLSDETKHVLVCKNKLCDFTTEEKKVDKVN